MYKAISINKRNTVIIMIVFLLIIGGIGAAVGILSESVVPAIIIVTIALVYTVIQYFAASRIAIAVNGGQEIQKSDVPELYRIVENLTITTGMPMPRVYIIQDSAPNAFATGRDPKHAMVAVTTGLLEIMSKREVEAIMAHEISHIRNYDIRVSMITFGLVSAIGLIADLLLRIAFYGSGRSRKNNNGAILILLGIAAYIVAVVIAPLIQLAVSRQREYLADASGALTTRDPEGLAMALEKLKTASRPMERQNSSTAHLFFANPMKTGLLSKLFSTHPPLDDRIARLQNNANRM